jgi:hypothetical protein
MAPIVEPIGLKRNWATRSSQLKRDPDRPLLAQSGRSQPCPLLGDERKRDFGTFRSVDDPGCAKNHPDKPWDVELACICGAGAPCACNQTEALTSWTSGKGSSRTGRSGANSRPDAKPPSGPEAQRGGLNSPASQPTASVCRDPRTSRPARSGRRSSIRTFGLRSRVGRGLSAPAPSGVCTPDTSAADFSV